LRINILASALWAGRRADFEVLMPLFLNNEEINQLITMKDTMEALEILYREMGEGKAVTAPRFWIAGPKRVSSC
jgi:ornithine cyclodeaminase/alanine dehydrogenase-like protein (mu-crystallin family)